MDRVKKAEELFLQGYNCSQAVFGAFADRYDFTQKQAMQLTSTLGAGVSSRREVCGAVLGMSLVCGMEAGNWEPVTEKKAAAYEANRKLLDEFQEEFGSIVCRELLNLRKGQTGQAPSERTPEYYAKRPCLRLVRYAASLLERCYPDKEGFQEEYDLAAKEVAAEMLLRGVPMDSIAVCTRLPYEVLKELKSQLPF
ncbi:MAG: C-GCAxxG-C-C family protein [Clostridiales bacterium]|nr:C-GCAxxG-C-C family protein [Clostridiales bacterium]